MFERARGSTGEVAKVRSPPRSRPGGRRGGGRRSQTTPEHPRQPALQPLPARGRGGGPQPEPARGPGGARGQALANRARRRGRRRGPPGRRTRRARTSHEGADLHARGCSERRDDEWRYGPGFEQTRAEEETSKKDKKRGEAKEPAPYFVDRPYKTLNTAARFHDARGRWSSIVLTTANQHGDE